MWLMVGFPAIGELGESLAAFGLTLDSLKTHPTSRMGPMLISPVARVLAGRCNMVHIYRSMLISICISIYNTGGLGTLHHIWSPVTRVLFCVQKTPRPRPPGPPPFGPRFASFPVPASASCGPSRRGADRSGLPEIRFPTCEPPLYLYIYIYIFVVFCFFFFFGGGVG